MNHNLRKYLSGIISCDDDDDGDGLCRGLLGRSCRFYCRCFFLFQNDVSMKKKKTRTEMKLIIINKHTHTQKKIVFLQLNQPNGNFVEKFNPNGTL